MATLKDLFEEKSQNIYKKFAPSGDQPVVIKPDTDGVFGSRSRVKNDTRSVPTVSVLRDTRRVSKFLTSSEGVLFLAKQTLLQTGNTFVNTKLYNPVSPLLNTVPFIHARRHIPTQTLVPNAPGLLQNNTVENITSKFVISGQLQAFSSGKRSLLPTITSIAKTYLATQLKNAANSIIPLPQNYIQSRPEYKVFTDVTGPVVFSPQPLDQRGLPLLSLKANIKNVIVNKARTELIKGAANALNRLIPEKLRNTIPPITPPADPIQIPTFVQAAVQFRQNFYDRLGTKNNRMKNKYFSESDAGFPDIGDNPSNRTSGVVTSGPTNTKDLYNIPFVAYSDDPNTINYANISGDREPESDIIKFIFRDVDGNNPIYFRALLSSIKESIKTEFNEQRYVGRTERFVTYGGAKRGLNLSFNIAAFSQNEADGMWSRVNYLSGLAFPKTVQNGFMVPPLFKITIGQLYDNQPCYIESLDYDFLDETITFDVDKEVPFAINVTMLLSILEKRSKFHDSPFYKITEKITEDQTKEQQRLRDIKLPGAEIAAKEILPQFNPTPSPLQQTNTFTPRIVTPTFSSIPSRL